MTLRPPAIREFLIVGMIALVGMQAHAEPAVPIEFRVIAVYPHDPNAFTQGLVYEQGKLFESTGLRGRSQVRIVDLESGRVLARKRLLPALFGEGLAKVEDRLYQLTWQSGEGIIYQARDLVEIARFRYQGEGWGLAFDGSLIWMSDGSHRLTRRAPFGFRAVGEPLPVHLAGEPVKHLNELEYIDGAVFANVWQTDRIVRIDPENGRVTGWLELGDLLTRKERARADVLNGIAWDAEAQRLMVTGKFWPKLFVLKLLATQAEPDASQ